MGILNKIIAYREIVGLIIVVVILIIKGAPIQLIIYVTIAVAIGLFFLRLFMKYVEIRTMEFHKRIIENSKQKQKRSSVNGFNTDQKEQGSPVNRFKTEIEILKKLIHSCERYCIKTGYNREETSKFIDGRCKHFFDILIPIASVSPDLYQKLITERPSLEDYLKDSVDKYSKNKPAVFEIEADLINTLKTSKVFSSTPGSKVDLNKFSCVQFMVDKYGFSPELLHVIRKVDLELMRYIYYLYDSRLKDWIITDDYPR